jgi:hypothetical protein
MLYFVNDTASTEIYTKHIHTLCGQQEAFFLARSLDDYQPCHTHPSSVCPSLHTGQPGSFGKDIHEF